MFNIIIFCSKYPVKGIEVITVDCLGFRQRSAFSEIGFLNLFARPNGFGPILDDGPAVLHHHDAIGNGKDHLHVVFAKQNGDSHFIGKPFHQGKTPGGLFGGHAGGGFVENEQIRIVSERDGHLENFLISVGEGCGLSVGVIQESKIFEDPIGVFDPLMPRRPKQIEGALLV
jgi:hypothetical protein